MNRRTLPDTAVEFIKAQGYSVFMRDRADSYALFQGDNGIGYVQFDPMSGYTVTSVHRGNRESGTGYQIARHVDRLSPELLAQAIATVVPHWHRTDKAPSKFPDIEAYRAQGAFEAQYSEV